ncbi:hypothetical protein BB560_000912 [Smittium megazygosporum]|uniref:Uncharacterized protein n=2 Tax=Smittium megazygosporum TaxID=133381 RepID=A0A2T9ZJ29_9FUNG|nr:hypothetical protein BB560_000912 [Smittium megazygosporum]
MSTYYFVIVGTNDAPMYEAEFGRYFPEASSNKFGMDAYEFDSDVQIEKNKPLDIADFNRISKQLQLLGYTQYFNPENAELIKAILSDFELSMEKLKGLAEENTLLKNKNSILNIENIEQKKQIFSLRQDNNKLRSEVLREARKGETVSEKSDEKAREQEQMTRKLKLANSQIKNALKKALNDIEDERRSLDDKQRDFLKKINVTDDSTEVLDYGWIENSPELDELYTSCVKQLRSEERELSKFEITAFEASQNRISSLEEHISLLETLNEKLKKELDLCQNHINSRDIEIQRLQKQIHVLDKDTIARFSLSSNKKISEYEEEDLSVTGRRLEDQLEYAQSRVSKLEKEKQNLEAKLMNEKIEFKNKLSNMKGKEPVKNTSFVHSDDSNSALESKRGDSKTIKEEGGENTKSGITAPEEELLSFVETIDFQLWKLENELNQKSSQKASLDKNTFEAALKIINILKNTLDHFKGLEATGSISISEISLKKKLEVAKKQIESISLDRDNFKSLYNQTSEELRYERKSVDIKIAESTSEINTKLSQAYEEIKKLKGIIKRNHIKHTLSDNSLLGSDDDSLFRKANSDPYKNRRKAESYGCLKDADSGSDLEYSYKRITSKYADSAIQVQKLFEENKLLKSQISDLKDKSLKSSGHFSDEEIRFDKKQNYKELVEISKRYTHLLKEYEGLSKAHEGASKALKRAVADVDKWHMRVNNRDNEIFKIQKSLRNSAQVNSSMISEELDNLKTLQSALELSKNEYKSLYLNAKQECEDKKATIKQLSLEKDSLHSQLNSLLHRFERIQQQLKTSNYVSPDVSSYSISQAESFLSDTSLKTRLAKHRYFRSESDSDLKIQKNHSSDIENGNY